MGRDGAAGAEDMRMRWVRSGRRNLGRMAAVAVAVALVGHALLMAGGGHPAKAAHAIPVSMVASPHGSTAHHATITPDSPRTPHVGHEAQRASHTMHGAARSPAASTLDQETTVEHHPTGDDPNGDETAGCGGMLVLARPQAAKYSVSVEPLSVAGPVAVMPMSLDAVAESRRIASQLDPTDPPETRRALLQIYRI